MPKPTTETDRVYTRNQRIKVVTASIVVVLCTIWISYVLLAGRKVTVIHPTTPCDQLLISLGDLFDNERFEYVQLLPSEDRKTMVVGGTVKDKAELDELRQRIEAAAAKIAASSEPVQLDWQVKPQR